MKKTVQDYYENKESRWGYKLFLKGAQHFGLHPIKGGHRVSEWEAQKRHHDRIVEELKLEKNDKKLLDIGCGRGIVARDISHRYGLEITGIDLTPYIVEEAKKNSAYLENTPTFIEGSYQTLPFNDNVFDGLYAVETLSHATDLKKAVSEAFRVVKPGSRCVFFEYQIDTSVKLTKNEKKMYELVKDGSSMSSLDEFKDKGFIKLLNENGFRDIQTYDISLEAEKSFRRLYQFALVPYFFIKLLNLQKYFINATAAVEYYRLAKKGYLNYWIYSAKVTK